MTEQRADGREQGCSLPSMLSLPVCLQTGVSWGHMVRRAHAGSVRGTSSCRTLWQGCGDADGSGSRGSPTSRRRTMESSRSWTPEVAELTKDQIKHRASFRWVQLHEGVYRAAGAPATWRGDLVRGDIGRRFAIGGLTPRRSRAVRTAGRPNPTSSRSPVSGGRGRRSPGSSSTRAGDSTTTTSSSTTEFPSLAPNE